MNIDLSALENELRHCGTDDRFTRAIMILARRINESMERRDSDLEGTIENIIDRRDDRKECHRMMRGF